jgi:hypothetical protein
MQVRLHPIAEDLEPTVRELRAIEAEWPSIAADLAAVDAEVAALQTGHGCSELARHRLRRVPRSARQIVAEAAHSSFGGAA